MLHKHTLLQSAEMQAFVFTHAPFVRRHAEETTHDWNKKWHIKFGRFITVKDYQVLFGYHL